MRALGIAGGGAIRGLASVELTVYFSIFIRGTYGISINQLVRVSKLDWEYVAPHPTGESYRLGSVIATTFQGYVSASLNATRRGFSCRSAFRYKFLVALTKVKN